VCGTTGSCCDLVLLRHIKKKSLEYLKKNFGEGEYDLGFHTVDNQHRFQDDGSTWATAIPHLHMHCIKPPYRINPFSKFFNIFRDYNKVEESLQSEY